MPGTWVFAVYKVLFTEKKSWFCLQDKKKKADTYEKIEAVCV